MLQFISLSMPFLNTTQTYQLISLPFLYQIAITIVAALKKLESVWKQNMQNRRKPWPWTPSTPVHSFLNSNTSPANLHTHASHVAPN